jgi:hypothetical protein
MIVLTNTAVSIAIVALGYLFVGTFALTWGPSSWTYPAEIFPLRIRTLAVSLSTASNWFFNMVLAFSVPPLLWNINWKTYMIFAAFNGAAVIHVFFAAPETKGWSLEEMGRVFEGGGAWKEGLGLGWGGRGRDGRLEVLEREIEAGRVKVCTPWSRGEKVGSVEEIEERNRPAPSV